MTVFVRYENAAYPLIRVLSADTFAADGSGPWTELDYWEAGAPDVLTSENGVYFEECSRQVLPGIGDAVLTMQYGTIDGVTVTAPDLQGKHIRIQAADNPADETETPAWRTIWVGRCTFQEDALDAASLAERGVRTYRCLDLLHAYLSYYPMDRHADYRITGNLAYGHPGYNYDKEAPGVVMGNREATGGSYGGPDSTSIVFCARDDADAGITTNAWTEAQAVENILLLRRSAGDPIFDLDDPESLLSEVRPIPVNDTETAWDTLLRILNRRRGKGMAFLDWEDDVATPDGALDVKLRVRPQKYGDITYTFAAVEYTINGSNRTSSYNVAVDLQGDHRVAGPVTVRDNADSLVDELTTEGEQVEVAVTVSGADGTHAYRWTDELETAWQTAFDAGDMEIAAQEVYKPVLQYYGLTRLAGTNYENGDGGGAQRADWWTTAAGLLTLPSGTVASPSLVEVMDDLPLYEGYDYSVNPPVPAESGAKDGKPRRRKPFLCVRVASGRFKLPEEYLDGGCQVSVDADGYWAEWTGRPGARNCRDGDTVTEDSMTFTLGLRMPQRVRMTSTISGTVRRRLSLRIPDCHLWIGHAGAIYDLDGEDVTDDGSAPLRLGGTMTADTGSVAGSLLRDDRAKLARVHAMAWEWYRSDSARVSGQWSLRACGFLPSWRDLGGGDIPYPRLGQMVTTMQAGGSSRDWYTPISRVHYDNRACLSTWATDWQEFDHGTA